MNGADTAFILAAAGLVMLMTPGLALFYGGMVRGKNVLGTFLQSFFLVALISLERCILVIRCRLDRMSVVLSVIFPGLPSGVWGPRRAPIMQRPFPRQCL